LNQLQRVDKTKILFLILSGMLVLLVIVWQMGTTGPHIEPIASDACVACHLDASAIAGMYIPPETPQGGGG
jgi:hypothetical protein